MTAMIREFILIVLVAIDLVISLNCTSLYDGLYETSCQSATKCLNGTASKIDCHIPMVVNEETGDCDLPLNVKSPCGALRDCSAQQDGGYALLKYNCVWYYLCHFGILYGHNKCASGLVWNSVLQTCDYKYNVLPPCGTRTK